MSNVTTPPVVLVLASGRGERFIASGGTTHKLDALLHGKPVLEHTLDAVRASGLPWHLERQAHAGMGDAIAAAVRATQHAPGWLVLPGDLPLIQPQSLLRVAQALLPASDSRAGHARGPMVVMPEYLGHRGHPVGFAAACGPALMQLQGDLGAVTVVRAQAELGQLLRLALDDAGAITDIDTLADLQHAAGLVQARPS